MAKTKIKRKDAVLTPVQLMINSFVSQYGTENPSKITDTQREGIATNATVKLCLAMVNAPIKSLDYQLDFDENDENAVTQREFVRLFFEPYVRELIELSLIAKKYGRNTVFRHWQVVNYEGEVKISPKRYGNPKPQDVTIKEDEYKEFLGVRFNNKNYLDEDGNILHIVYNGEFNNLYGNSVLDDLYQDWYDYKLNQLYYLRYNERVAGPTIEVGYPDGQGETDENGDPIDNQAVALNIGKQVMSNSSVAIPTDNYTDDKGGDRQWTIGTIDVPEKGEEFLKFLTHGELMMCRSLLMPDNAITRSGSTGTYAESQEKADLMSNVIEQDAFFVARYIQVELDFLLSQNFAEPASIQFMFEPVVDAKKEMLNRMIEKLTGDPLVKRMLVERFAETMDRDLDEVEESAMEYNEKFAPDIPAVADNKKSQPDGKQQENMNDQVKAENEMDRIFELANEGDILSAIRL